MFWFGHDKAPVSETVSQTTAETVQPEPVIDYDRMEKDAGVRALMRERKEAYGVNDGIDLIMKGDESLKIGDSTVSMREILEKIRLKKGDIIEKDIRPETGSAGPGGKRPCVWNIHRSTGRQYLEYPFSVFERLFRPDRGSAFNRLPMNRPAWPKLRHR
jgi:hypothetical protein